jgi:hypothetical protein
MLAEIAQTSWDPKTGTLTMVKELAQERTTADLMNGVVHANVGQKLLFCDKIKIFLGDR